MKLLICDPTAPDAIAKMRAAGIEVDVRDDISADELMKVIPEYHGMVVRSRTKVRQPLIDVARNLKLIVRGGVGLDNIDVDYARSKGITVMNTPAASSISVAELTIGYLFALARRIPDATASMRAGKWEKKALSKGTELTGKTLGLIGCGRIGQQVVKRAAALGMTVLFYRRTKVNVPNATQVSLDELLTKSDYISLHVPHTPETHHIIGAPEFAKMKDGVYIVNCGRGGTRRCTRPSSPARWPGRRWTSSPTRRRIGARSCSPCRRSSARRTSAPGRARPGLAWVKRWRRRSLPSIRRTSSEISDR